MMKKLLTINLILCILMFCISLLYAGFQYGRTFDNRYPSGQQFFVFPPIYLVFVLVGWYLRSSCEITKPITYYIWGSVIFAFIVFFFIRSSIYHAYGRLSDRAWDMLWCPVTVLICSFTVFVFDIICAIQTHREDKILKKKFDTTA